MPSGPTRNRMAHSATASQFQQSRLESSRCTFRRRKYSARNIWRRAVEARPASQFASGLELQALGQKSELRFEIRHTLLDLLDFLTFGIGQVTVLQRLDGFSAAR